MSSPTGTLRIGPDVAWTSESARVVALDLTDPAATPFALEHTAAIVWEEIADAGEIAVTDLLQRLYEQFDADPELIRRDVDQLVDDLVARGLLIRG